MTSRKDVWKHVYQILGQHKDSNPTQINYNGRLISSPQELANSFNEIFLEKVHKLKASISNESSNSPVDRLANWLNGRDSLIQDFNLKPIEKCTLRKLVTRLKGSRTSGYDQVDSFSLKLAAPFIEDILLHLVNLSLVQYPECWKTQLVHPFHKKGDKSKGENYRPVSHIPEVSKLVEYAVQEQIRNHFEANDLFHRNHHGFLPFRNTATALLQIYDIFLANAEKKEISGALFLDLSAAFDIVDHSILLRKLTAYGFTPSAVAFFKSYLSNRLQRV